MKTEHRDNLTRSCLASFHQEEPVTISWRGAQSSLPYIDQKKKKKFREGNGRTARLLSDLMTVQADWPPLNFSSIDQTENAEGFDKYISAIHHGVGENYEPIKNIFFTLLSQSKL